MIDDGPCGMGAGIEAIGPHHSIQISIHRRIAKGIQGGHTIRQIKACCINQECIEASLETRVTPELGVSASEQGEDGIGTNIGDGSTLPVALNRVNPLGGVCVVPLDSILKGAKGGVRHRKHDIIRESSLKIQRSVDQ